MSCTPQTVWTKTALLPDGWAEHVRIDIDAQGRIAQVTPGSPAGGTRTDILLPGVANLHSHAFQRAMAGLTEYRGAEPSDNFWTWRQLMYRFLDRLTPEHVQAIAGFVQMEMLEAGFTSVGEFHYLHHAPGGVPYGCLHELSTRICAAADQTGIGLTLLPVLYQTAGCDGRVVGPGQVRFYNDADRFFALVEGAQAALDALPADAALGLAPHSLRSVTAQGLRACIDAARGRPLHMHVAEQVGEVEEVVAHRGARPMEWLFANAAPDAHWCMIHATQMQPHETEMLARSGAVAGLCPITESSLGDGIFDGVRYQGAGGRFGIGSDSNIRISLCEELRTLEYSQRLRDKARAVLTCPPRSNGRTLYDAVCAGGAQALGREAGALEVGGWADMLALDGAAVDLEGRSGDTLLDCFVMAGDGHMVRDVWAAGRHVVQDGRHVSRDAVTAGYRAALADLRDAL